jgi:hypothetical protein
LSFHGHGGRIPPLLGHHSFRLHLSSNPELKKNTMSVAEKLISLGREEGLWIGRIQLLEEFLDLPASSGEALAALSLEELKAMQERLHGEYQLRFKRR